MKPTQMLYCDSSILVARCLAMTVTKEKKVSTPSDSTTNVDKVVEKVKIRFEDKLTVRCDIETKKALKRFSEQTGITECQIIHGLLTAYLYGMQQKFQYVDKSPTINLTIERAVKRVRRYGVEGESDADAGSALGEHAVLCHYCLMEHRNVAAVGTYTYVKTMKVYGLCHYHAEAMLDSKNWR